MEIKSPLWPIARSKYGTARSDRIRASTENEPADSPKIVIFFLNYFELKNIKLLSLYKLYNFMSRWSRDCILGCSVRTKRLYINLNVPK